MSYTIKDIEFAINEIKKDHKAPIMRHCNGYIILAQNELDWENKKQKILRGDTMGFCKVEDYKQQ